MSDLNIELVVKERREESADCLSVFFARPREIRYAPGDWMDIRFPTPEFPVGRTYSFASSPTEPDLRIAFKRGVSPFKRRLERTTPGETMLVTQHGSNGFVLDRRYPSVFVAGGVGITPFRSMIKDLVDTTANIDVSLIYLNRTPDFPFRQELDAWAQDSPSLAIQYVSTGTEGRLTKAMLRRLLPDIAERPPMGYIAGPPGMVDQTQELLQTIGVGSDDIKVDRFDGY